MIKSKLHNPVIAKNSVLENVVVEKVSSVKEQVFSNMLGVMPVIPESGRIWFNYDTGAFRFANIDSDNKIFIDEYLSKTDKRKQHVLSEISFDNSISVNAGGAAILSVDATLKDISVDVNNFLIDASDTISIATDNLEVTVGNKTSLNFTKKTEVLFGEAASLKANRTLSLLDANNLLKIKADNIEDKFTIIYGNVDILVDDSVILDTSSGKFIIRDSGVDRFVSDSIKNSLDLTYTNLTADVAQIWKLKNGIETKILADNAENILTVNYAETNIYGNTTLDGNVFITGDLMVGGQTTKLNIASENMTIADNVIVLNSNLTTEDPRVASAYINGVDVDHNAGVAVNRGNQGVLDLIKWVESTDISTPETLYEGTANVSIWNYESAVPAYELHQILDMYTAARTVKDKSGSSKIGYDGHVGENFASAIGTGADVVDAAEYAFQLGASALDEAIDIIANEIDSLKFNTFNPTRVGETTSSGKSFTIRHNLGTVFVDVKIQRFDSGGWFFDVMPIQVLDQDTIRVTFNEVTKIRFMISAVQGFDINYATDLIVL